MKLPFYVLIFALCSVLAACAPTIAVDSAFRQDVSLAKTGSITVLRDGPDPVNLQSALEFMLLKQGFNVASEAVARDAISVETNTSTSTTPSGSNTQTQVTAGPVRILKSRLILRYTYSVTTFNSLPGKLRVTSLEASLIDLVTGEFLGKIVYQQKAGVANSTSEIAQIIINEIQKKVQQ